MPRRHLDVSFSHDEFEDLNNALEDHRDGFKKMAMEAENGFGLEPAYWTGRAEQVEGLRNSVLEHSTEQSEEPERSQSSVHARERDSEPDSRP